MIFDHLGISVRDAGRSKAFFAAALAPLGIEPLMTVRGWVGFGRERPQFWIGAHNEPHKPMHVAFVADSREQVRAFHARALAAGGTDNGAPGIRELYHPDYYAAFVICPDGHNLEAVCHLPEASNEAQRSM